MELQEKSRGGRPRGFDRDQAVATAMRLFWRHGYEGVSIADLTAAIGVAAPSLYAAFGSKAGLYREALALYEAKQGAFDPSCLEQAPSLADGVRRLLKTAIAAVTRPGEERGCMISSGVIACHADHAALAALMAERRNSIREALARRLRRWVGQKEASALARHLSAVMQGISIQARDGATPRELLEIVDQVIAGLPAGQSPSEARSNSS